jgi:hypothetical protein
VLFSTGTKFVPDEAILYREFEITEGRVVHVTLSGEVRMGLYAQTPRNFILIETFELRHPLAVPRYYTNWYRYLLICFIYSFLKLNINRQILSQCLRLSNRKETVKLVQVAEYHL